MKPTLTTLLSAVLCTILAQLPEVQSTHSLNRWYFQKRNKISTSKTNLTNFRRKRENLQFVDLNHADLHRVAACTKAPGKFICKSGKYNYIINNGNLEIPAETLEKFVSALYEKAKEKTSDFAISLVTPEKEAETNWTQAEINFHNTMQECGSHVQPITIECELTDTSVLKQANPYYHLKPNERIFKCITKHNMEFEKGVQPLVSSSLHEISDGILHNSRTNEPQGGHTLLHLANDNPLSIQEAPHDVRILSNTKQQTQVLDGKLSHRALTLRLSAPPKIKGRKYISRRSSLNPSIRPSVRDYQHFPISADPRGGHLSPATPCPYTRCADHITLYPPYYTKAPSRVASVNRIRKRFRNPLLDFIMPYGLRDWIRPNLEHNGMFHPGTNEAKPYENFESPGESDGKNIQPTCCQNSRSWDDDADEDSYLEHITLQPHRIVHVQNSKDSDEAYKPTTRRLYYTTRLATKTLSKSTSGPDNEDQESCCDPETSPRPQENPRIKQNKGNVQETYANGCRKCPCCTCKCGDCWHKSANKTKKPRPLKNSKKPSTTKPPKVCTIITQRICIG